MKGIDFAWGGPRGQLATVKSLGYGFIARYLSTDSSKNLALSEKNSALANGLGIVVVWETGATRVLGGHAAGVSDAQAADAEARALGLTGIPIYFACDFDATAADQAAINAYLDGAASVIGRARVGLYAGYYPIKRAFDAGKITFGWQTYAWSGGQWDSRAQLRQVQNSISVLGFDCDLDVNMAANYGQFNAKVTPPLKPEDQVLKQGDSGTAVAYLQKRLNVWGAKLTVDSSFGALTLAAVKAFQTQQKLTSDGVVGPATWTSLDKAPAPPNGAFAAPTGLAVSGKKVSVTVKWNAVAAVGGKSPTGYTAQCYQMNGVKVGDVTVTGTSARFDNLVVGWQYKIVVWANGGPVAPPSVQLTITA